MLDNRKFKDNCLGDVVTLREAVEHVIAFEKQEDDEHNEVLKEKYPQWNKLTMENYESIFKEEELVDIVSYYDYAEVK